MLYQSHFLQPNYGVRRGKFVVNAISEAIRNYQYLRFELVLLKEVVNQNGKESYCTGCRRCEYACPEWCIYILDGEEESSNEKAKT